MFFPSVNGKSILGRFKLKMKFEEIIRESGIKPEDVPNVSQLPVTLFDSKAHEIHDNPLKFADPIFEKNPHSRAKFLQFCMDMESALRYGSDRDKPTCLYAVITVSQLLVGNYLTAPKRFPR